MTLDTWFLFVGAAVLLSLTPGPNGLLALTHGGLYGARRTVFTVSGGVLGFTLIIGLSMTGLSALLAASEWLYAGVKWTGAVYLIYLGVRTWRSSPLSFQALEGGGVGVRRERAAHRLFLEGFLVAISNPKVILFFGAFLPQFIDTSVSMWYQFLAMIITFMSIEFAFEMLLAMFSQRLLPWLDSPGRTRWFQRLTGGFFVLAGGSLFVFDR